MYIMLVKQQVSRYDYGICILQSLKKRMRPWRVNLWPIYRVVTAHHVLTNNKIVLLTVLGRHGVKGQTSSHDVFRDRKVLLHYRMSIYNIDCNVQLLLSLVFRYVSTILIVGEYCTERNHNGKNLNKLNI